MNDGQSPEARAARKARELEKGYNGNGGGEPLAYQAGQWQTPATDNPRARGLEREDLSLDQQAKAGQWPTPDSPGPTSGVRNRQASRGKGHQQTIAEAAEHWCTPSARDHKGGYSEQAMVRKDGKSRADDLLPQQVENWAAPRAEDSESSGARLSRGIEDTLTAQSRSFLPGPAMPEPGDQSSASDPSSRRRLNHAFTAWLKGWPLPSGGIGSGCSATEWSRWRQRMRSQLYFLLK
jgi:hypothetical protein